RDLVVDLLTEMGYRALQAVDGPSGLAIALSDVSIDQRMTDVGLPGFHGCQRAAAADDQRPGQKILCVTCEPHNATVSNDLLSPGMQMITKPFALEILAERIRDLSES